MLEGASGEMTFNPAHRVRREAACFPGLRLETVHVSGSEAYDYKVRPDWHLLTLNDRVLRSAGETCIEGAGCSTQRDLSGKMCVVPAGHGFSGWLVPRVPPSTTYCYLDPHAPAIDPDLGFAEAEIAPRLLFDDPSLRATMVKLQGLLRQPGTASRLYAETLMAVLAVELVRQQQGTTGPVARMRGGLAGWQLRTVREHIEEHLADDLSLARLAGLARLSPTHFCRAFKQSVGVAPHRFQMLRRIERAKTLLADPRCSITDVAFACGFSSSSSFAAAFRKLSGHSASEYRRSLH